MLLKHVDEDAAVYALDALDPDESRRIEAHCAICPPCCRLIEDARQWAYRLGLLSPPATPPPGLKRRLMVRISHDQPEQRLSPDQLPRARMLFGVLATMLVLSLLYNVRLHFVQRSSAEQLAAMEQHLDEERSFLLRDGTVWLTLAATTNAAHARGKMVMLPGDDTAMLVVDGLRALPEGQVYQCWLRGDGAPIPLATFTVDASGDTTVMVKANLADYKSFLITIEPTAGAQAPGPVVLEGKL